MPCWSDRRATAERQCGWTAAATFVLDPFVGSGSTLIACEKTGRRARLVELDPKYADTIILRWQEFSGGTATLDGDGRSYEEIAAGREAANNRPTAA